MKYEILDGQTIVNTIMADPGFMLSTYPAGNYRKAPEPEAPAVRLTKLTQDQLLRRLTPAEFKGIRNAAKVNADIDMWLYRFERALEIDLADPDTIAGVRALEAGGLLATGRAAEILA